ncbi:serpin family protein [uncultured Proteiniphilum sp.]|uniref:serpin family protein n=1 Tax=uncultured Proteiniphilum sp. TaxID=497637 RepID=UPI002639F48E|nr:serpin family protein [uncultured Proteiniphilum sp.]
MQSKIYSFTMVIVASLFLSVSCDKNGGDVRTGDLPDPIRIDLRSSEQEMVRADQSFAFEFFENVFVEESLQEDNNFMVSPLSLSMALAMTWNGAAGETKTAMQRTLKMDDFPDDELNGYYKKLKEALLKTDPSTKLSIANAVFTNQFITIKPDFISANRSFYDATVQSVDFTRAATVDIINNWASDNTNGLIKKVIDNTKPEDLMYLLNAIYFKGIWTSEFDKKNTSERPFTYESGTRKNVEMMKQTAKFNYTEDGNLQLVQLPYGNQAFSMMVLLPAEGKKLQDVVTATRQQGYWGGLKSALREAEVDLSLPKFKTEYSKELNEVLTKMGMEIAFTKAADFSRMSDAPAKISFVKQDTYITTDESGTEAAAVTTIGMELTSFPMKPDKVVFNANRPFLYLIQENSTGAILFMGAVKNFDK